MTVPEGGERAAALPEAEAAALQAWIAATVGEVTMDLDEGARADGFLQSGRAAALLV